jgi:glycosyltransferase involved in cell wall biosynthesis
MRVLVVIPTHDRTEFYREAIDSVFMQTRQADELVVTGNVGPGVLTNASLADRINDAISRSDCDAFVILCDDDQLKPDYIERTAKLMEESGVDIVYTDCTVFGDRDCEASALGEWNQTNIDRNTVPLVTSLMF